MSVQPNVEWMAFNRPLLEQRPERDSTRSDWIDRMLTDRRCSSGNSPCGWHIYWPDYRVPAAGSPADNTRNVSKRDLTTKFRS